MGTLKLEMLNTEIKTRSKPMSGLTRTQKALLSYHDPLKLVNEESGSIAIASETSSLLDAAGNSEHPTLADIAKVLGQEYATMLILNNLSSLLSFADTGLVRTQYADVILLLASEYYYINTKEWLLFFRKCKLGEYGQMIWGDKLNTQQLMMSVRSFLSDRATAIQRKDSEKKTEPLKTQGANIVKGIESVKELSQRAKTDYKAFRELYPRLPSDRAELVYWRAWRLNELRVGKYLCEFNIKNK